VTAAVVRYPLRLAVLLAGINEVLPLARPAIYHLCLRP
jgi:hypothetical protein